MSIHRLYGELAASLVRYTAADELRAIAGAELGGIPTSSIENACAMLGKLHVARCGRVAGTMKLAIDGSRVAQFVTDLSRAGEISLPPLDEVFAVWISCAAGQWDHGSVRREPFVPHDDIRPVMGALVDLGYAKPYGNAVMWTDKIASAMRMSGEWDENNLSHEEVEEREIDLEMRDAFASIPEDVWHTALRGDRGGVVKALAARWVDGAWLVDSDPELPWWALCQARRVRCAMRLIELVKGAGAAATCDVN
jgi:hypothetical protein